MRRIKVGYLHHGRRDNREVVEFSNDGHLQRWTRERTIYDHCLGGYIMGECSLFERAPREISTISTRRLSEVELQLLQQ
ncbi:hypothetical protein ACSPJ8_002784 [Klebsiella aerogenes]|uniref:hypothetical protein n=1 Tax=Klebsiella aerogenes TaxID=548 RepID=UPI00397D9444|nr:hypothetical protein [Klebsiella aerogenes]